MIGDVFADPRIMVAIGVAVDRQRSVATVVQGVAAATDFLVQTLIVKADEDRVAGAVGGPKRINPLASSART